MTRSLPVRESLEVEFKSDRKRLSDGELVEAIVCLTNTEGGVVYLGVEDDGTATGLHSAHAALEGLPAMVANRTTPSVAVSVEKLDLDGIAVARIKVPKARSVVATSEGLMKRRRIGANGMPECVPMAPHEIPTRLSDLGALDATSQPVPGATPGDLDPVERGRLRQFIERFGGDQLLQELADEE